ncbi:MAG TPA: glycerol-3-phosphate acyltransferase [Geomonas sp.]|nr:glycerol-3-phosphate acyltransferase [Geomonas sp.]
MTSAIYITLFSYLLGCCTFGYYLVYCFTGQDIRATGSGNVGSRNVGRLLGTKGFLLTLAGDAGKGALAVYLARHFSSEPWAGQLALLAATCGHVWPLQLRFRGGKGFATLAGGLLLVQPVLLLTCLALCILLYPVLKRTTKTALPVLACSPLISLLLARYGRITLGPGELPLYTLLVVIVLFAHRSNIVSEFGPTDTKGDS